MTDASKPFFVQALEALKAGDRRRAANLLARELGESNTALKNLPSVARLAEHIGEVDLAIEASRRSTVPGSIESQLSHWAVLATHGRSEEALDELRRQPARVREHPWVLHFRGTVANQFGQFDEAEALFRRVLRAEPAAMQTWFTLAMLKRFEAGDPDIEAMDQLDRRQVGPIEARASLRYALGKAWEDVGEVDQAFAYYSSGAALRGQQGGSCGTLPVPR
jgi:tetratricopeptide (TPR) repeat protein